MQIVNIPVDFMQLAYTCCTSEIVMEDHGRALYGLLNDNFPLQTRGFPVPESFHEVQKGPRTNHSTIQRLGSNSSLQVWTWARLDLG